MIATQSAVLLFYIDWNIDLEGPPEPDYLYYKVRSKNGNRTSDEFSNTVKVAGPGEFGKEISGDDLNTEENFNYQLNQNYPNPFNPTTVISFSIQKEAFVTLTIFDILGNNLTTLISEKLNAGYHSVKFNGSKLNSGIYFYEIRTDNFREVKKLVIAK